LCENTILGIDLISCLFSSQFLKKFVKPMPIWKITFELKNLVWELY